MEPVTIDVAMVVRRVRVEHDVIRFYGEDDVELAIVDHPSHPGAGLGLELSEAVQVDA